MGQFRGEPVIRKLFKMDCRRAISSIGDILKTIMTDDNYFLVPMQSIV
jgi:spore coat protein CotF